MSRSEHHSDEVYRARVGQCDRLFGAFCHDLGNVVLPRREGVEADDSEQGAPLRTLRRQSAAVVEHLMTLRAAADCLRADGREAGATLPLGEWWWTAGRFCRSMLAHQPSLRLVVEDADDDDVLIDPRRAGRPLLLALIALDERYDLERPVLLRVAVDGGTARFESEAPRPPARATWPSSLVTDVEALGGRIVARGGDEAGCDLLSLAFPEASVSRIGRADRQSVR